MRASGVRSPGSSPGIALCGFLFTIMQTIQILYNVFTSDLAVSCVQTRRVLVVVNAKLACATKQSCVFVIIGDDFN